MNSDQLRKLIDMVSEGAQGMAEGSSESVSFREMINVVDEHYPKYYAELSGSDISDEQFKQEIISTYNEITNKQSVAEGLDPTKKRRLYDLIELYRDATDPANDEYDDPDEVIAMIRSEFGDKIAGQVAAGAHKMHYPRHSGYRSDPLGWKKPVDRITKAGKMYKQDSDYIKNTIRSRYALSGKSATEGVAEGKRTLRDYMAESETAYSRPVQGDNFAINIREEVLLETYVVNSTDDAIVIHADNKIIETLASFGFLSEGDISQLEKDVADAPVKPIASMEAQDLSIADAGEYDYEGDMAKDDLETIVRAARRLAGMLDDNENMPEWVQSKINKAADYVDTAADYIESNRDEPGMAEGEMAEAKYQGREVPLGKPMAGDVKKSKVYVRGPKGNVVKVNFGQKGMKIKKSIPGRRKNFRARHNCDNPGPRWKARYWSCRAW